MNIVLISFYELGRPPFGLASPAAWLKGAGFDVHCTDNSIQSLSPEKISGAELIGCYVPMHTATRLAINALEKIRKWNSRAHICFYGLYACLNEDYLRRKGVHTILSGEFESGLLSLAKRLQTGDIGSSDAALSSAQIEPVISLARQKFQRPDRTQLPPPVRYAQLCQEGQPPKLTGYTEASRGCRHTCRHCPVVPVYNGRFRIVQQDVVLADIRQQVEAGVEHITFGDPDFFNGPGHVLPIVQALHQQFPELTYDVTIKIEHLLKYRRHLPVLKNTGCEIITSAVESVDEYILHILNKGHSRKDFQQAAKLVDDLGLVLNPTFVPFTPWTTLENYRDLLQEVAELDLIENVAPVQYAIRLLIPEGSRFLELDETRKIIRGFNEELLSYEWVSPDPRMEELHLAVTEYVNAGNVTDLSRGEVFEKIWRCTQAKLATDAPRPSPRLHRSRSEIPYLNEPWYC